MSLAALLADPSAVFALHQVGASSAIKLAKSMLKDTDYQKVWHLLPEAIKAEQAIIRACKAQDDNALQVAKTLRVQIGAKITQAFKA